MNECELVRCLLFVDPKLPTADIYLVNDFQ